MIKQTAVPCQWSVAYSGLDVVWRATLGGGRLYSMTETSERGIRETGHGTQQRGFAVARVKWVCRASRRPYRLPSQRPGD
jgi:hypothetical protein